MQTQLPLPTQQGNQGKQRSRVINNGDPLRGKWVKRFFCNTIELYFREKILYKLGIVFGKLHIQPQKDRPHKTRYKSDRNIPRLNGLDNCHFSLPHFDTRRQWNRAYLVRPSYINEKSTLMAGFWKDDCITFITLKWALEKRIL